MKPARRVLLCVGLLLLAGCSGKAAPGVQVGRSPTPGPPSSASPGADPAAQAAAIVARLGDEDLVGQVLMPYAYGNDATNVSADSKAGNQKLGGVDTPAQLVAKYRVGGMILVQQSADPTSSTNPTSNVESPAQVRRLTGGLQAAGKQLPAGVPLLIGTDQEYGSVTRIKDGLAPLPAAMGFGAAGDPALTKAAWGMAGAELAALGVNVDFAPVADTLGTAGSAVIGTRAYGSDPKLVGPQVAAAVGGLQGAGVGATLKHFPGHGHTTADSHTELPVLAQSADSLRANDLPPFKAGIDAGAWLVMSGHLDVRSMDPGVPASLSHKLLTDVLRGEMGFTGVVASDALNMQPVAKFGPAEEAVRAVLAGNDLLLWPPDLPGAYKGLLDALHSGKLPKPRLVEAVTRVVTLKLRLAQIPQPDMSTVDSAAHREVAGKAAAGSVTVVKGACTGPLARGPVKVTASGGNEARRDQLVEALRRQGVAIGDGGSRVHLLGFGDDASDLAPDAAVTVAMDAPYVLASAKSPALVATFGRTAQATDALAAVLAGKAKAPGKLPVPVGNLPRSAC